MATQQTNPEWTGREAYLKNRIRALQRKRLRQQEAVRATEWEIDTYQKLLETL